ncbi:MAG TPA: DUF4124 domain-containing protein [Steroidobacteraceae bacterium]|nr:DUF4124 domain-containing protein [Steroidobacteraceae bacterium]
MLRRVPVIALMLAGCTLAQADVFRWVDDHGVPHYSDQWVPGSEVIKTGKVRPDSATMSPGASRAAQASKVSAQLADENNARAVQQDVAKTREAQCKKAQAAYTDSVTHRRVYKSDATGQRNYMSDAELDGYREQTRKNVLELCGSVPVIDPNAPIPEPQPVPEPKVNPADATSP